MSPERRPYFHVTSAGRKVARLPFSSRTSASWGFVPEQRTQPRSSPVSGFSGLGASMLAAAACSGRLESI